MAREQESKRSVCNFETWRTSGLLSREKCFDTWNSLHISISAYQTLKPCERANSALFNPCGRPWLCFLAPFCSQAFGKLRLRLLSKPFDAQASQASQAGGDELPVAGGSTAWEGRQSGRSNLDQPRTSIPPHYRLSVRFWGGVFNSSQRGHIDTNWKQQNKVWY